MSILIFSGNIFTQYRISKFDESVNLFWSMFIRIFLSVLPTVARSCWVRFEGKVVLVEAQAKVKFIKKERKVVLQKTPKNSNYSVFVKGTEFRDNKSSDWLRKGDLKKATEGNHALMAAREQALSMQHHIDKTGDTPMCRLRAKRESDWTF